MALPNGPTPLTVHRLGFLLLLGTLAAFLILFGAACQGKAGQVPTDTSAAEGAASDASAPDISPAEQTALAQTAVTIYSSPT